MTTIGDNVNQTEERYFPDQRCQRPPMAKYGLTRRIFARKSDKSGAEIMPPFPLVCPSDTR